jgi:hypothetical protein
MVGAGGWNHAGVEVLRLDEAYSETEIEASSRHLLWMKM